MNGIKACFFDIDGTLLRTDHTISQSVIEAVQRLEKEGVAPVIATGRSYEALLPIKESLGIHSPVICYNGAMIVDGKDGSVLKHHILPDREAKIIINMARDLDYHLLAYRRGELIFERSRVEADEYYNRILLEGRIVNFDDLDELDLTKCLIIGDHENLVPLKDEILKLYGDKLNAFFSDPRFLEIVPAGIDKAEGVREIMDILGEPMEKTMAMGDGYNDLSMLEAVHWGVVMDNALPSLKEKFPPERIAPHCDKDGVAAYLTDFFKWNS